MSSNIIGFTKQGGTFKFTPTDALTAKGRLGISCDNLISARDASIGIAMSGKSAFACHASPNMKYTFLLHPRYRTAFGKFDEGEVIDLNRMTQKFEISFRENQYDRKVELTQMNTWEDLSI